MQGTNPPQHFRIAKMTGTADAAFLANITSAEDFSRYILMSIGLEKLRHYLVIGKRETVLFCQDDVIEERHIDLGKSPEHLARHTEIP